MNYGKNTSQYLDIIFTEMRSFIDLDSPKEAKQLAKAIKNLILNIEPAETSKRKITRKQSFSSRKLFRPLSEILTTLEAIENISIYIRSFPYNRQRVSKISYLKYHIENYLNELYILRERLLSYLNIIERAYKKDLRITMINQTINKLQKIVEKAFEGYTRIRGVHVHQSRYSDEEIDRLSTLELFSNAKDKLGPFIDISFKLSYRDVRRKWVRKMVSDIANIQRLLELYFGRLQKVVSSKNKILYPFK